MEIQDRIKMVMKMHNKNASQFADTIEVQRSSVSHILNGRNKPSLDFVQKVLNHFPRVNAGWLISGKTTPDADLKAKTQTSLEIKTEATSHSMPVKPSTESKEKLIEKIVVFYKNGQFDQYFPNEQ